MTLTPQLSDFQFSNYRLLKLSFELNPEFVMPESGNSLSYQLSITSSVMANAEQDANDGLSKTVRLDVSVTWSESDGPFKLELACDGVFVCSKGMDQDQYNSLCELHAPALLYTQLRPIARMVTAEADETFMLPLINISETLKRSRKQEALSATSPASDKS